MKVSLAKALFSLAGLMLLISCHMLGRQSSLNQSYLPPSNQNQKSMAKPGRYVGYVRLASRQEKVAIFIDLVEAKAKQNQSIYHAIVRMNLGGFSGEEYHGEYFSSVVFDGNSNNLLFPQIDQVFHLVDVELKAGRMITGKINFNGVPVGDFMSVYAERQKLDETYRYVSQMYPDIGIVPEVRGFYKPVCIEKNQKSLQLISSRWQSTVSSRALFSEFKIQGIENGQLAYSKSAYNFLTGDLKLMDPKLYKSKGCQFVAGDLRCENCFYERVKSSSEVPEKSALARLLSRPARDSSLDGEVKISVPFRPDFPGAIAGEYFGMLFNETTEVYQPIRLKVNAEMKKSDGMTKPSLEVTAIANLFFGESSSNEFIVYPFSESFYSDSAPYFIFSGKGEGFLQVSNWYEDSIKGIWYSKTFGRVGSVVLKKSLNQISDVKRPTQMRKISGTYSGPEAKFSLLAQSGVSMNDYEFFPLGIKGLVVRSKSSSTQGRIDGATFDFYTGRFAMKLANGEIIVGEQTPSGVDLSWGSESDDSGLVRRAYDFQADPFSETSAKQMFDLMRYPFIR